MCREWLGNFPRAEIWAEVSRGPVLFLISWQCKHCIDIFVCEPYSISRAHSFASEDMWRGKKPQGLLWALPNYSTHLLPQGWEEADWSITPAFVQKLQCRDGGWSGCSFSSFLSVVGQMDHLCQSLTSQRSGFVDDGHDFGKHLWWRLLMTFFVFFS